MDSGWTGEEWFRISGGTCPGVCRIADFGLPGSLSAPELLADRRLSWRAPTIYVEEKSSSCHGLASSYRDQRQLKVSQNRFGLSGS